MSTLNYVESPLAADAAIHRQVIPAGDGWLHPIRRGQALRIVDLEGNQAADTLFYNLHDLSERYSAQDTIREQGAIYLTTGTILLSNLCRPMLTITADTCGRHDTLGGACAAESNMVRYALDKRFMHACRDTFLLQIALSGLPLTKRDLAHNINFFMNVPVTPEGGLRFEDGVSEPGKYVEMRAEMDVYCLLSNCPQLNNPCNAYNPTPVEVLIWNARQD
ncbi:MAG: urea carboxylase-associated family protein [Terrimicrobiaceae bacterium]|nr:urea carboxylase-associated family protein [Terrimicrobiaceae bacterium]